MISRIEGVLEAVHDGRALLRCDHVTYEVLIPGADRQRLARLVGERISFHTLHYLEAHSQGASYTPRLIGFASPRDRAFFELFTTVKGIGNRKALRAMQLPFGRIASAIAAKDADTLKLLPEIGRRSAETIVAELHGKVDDFVEARPPAGEKAATPPGSPREALAREAVSVLTTLGEPKLAAMELVDRALASDASIEKAEDLIAAAYRLKTQP